MKKLILVLIVALAVKAFPCTSDIDCSLGAECTGDMMDPGVCIGGMNNGNRNDRKPVYNPFDLKDPVGHSCSSDMDCGLTRHCIHGDSGSGVCY